MKTHSGLKGSGKDNKHRIGTPPEFRELLLAIARSATKTPNANQEKADMTKLTDMTMKEIEEQHVGQFIYSNDAGMVWDDEAEADVRALDVLVWDTEEESENDDGSNAVARYLIRDTEEE